MDIKINIYILSIFLKPHNFLIIFYINISEQHLVNTKKFTFEVDNLRNCRRKRDAMLTGWWYHHVYSYWTQNTHRNMHSDNLAAGHLALAASGDW